VATPSRTAIGSTMAREVVLDANVIVAQLDRVDVFSDRAQALGRRLQDDGAEIVLLDVLVGEAVSVICRRARERRNLQPNMDATLATVRNWAEAGAIRWVAGEGKRLIGSILGVIGETGARLNFNDALLVVLQREGIIGEVASFDRGFDVLPDFRRVD
jgi:predicted nucleic acid-binding protein